MNISINITIPFKVIGSKIAEVATQTDVNDIAKGTAKGVKFVGHTAAKTPKAVKNTTVKVASTTKDAAVKVAHKVHTPKVAETTEA